MPLRHVGYWQRKNYGVVAPIRPGYGGNGGDDERSGALYDAFGTCRSSQPDFETPAKNAARATLAASTGYAHNLWAAKDRIVLVGTSMGGVASVATAATNPAGVIGYMNFAGGAGALLWSRYVDDFVRELGP